MKVLKWIGAVALTALSAGVLAVSGVGAAVATADQTYIHDGRGRGDVVDVHEVWVPVSVFAPIYVSDVLNNLDILSHNDIDIHDVDVDVLSD